MASPIATFVSDIHLSSMPPAARLAENDWYDAQERILEQVRKIEKEYACPMFCCGDVFDRWKVTPKLINFAITQLPQMVSVPGQHDMPYHQSDMMHMSPYRTLEHARRLMPFSCHVALRKTNHVFYSKVGEFYFLGFQFGEKLVAPKKARKPIVIVSHKFVWSKRDNAYTGAPPTNNVSSMKVLNEYDMCFFGDNHIPFEHGNVVNCGCLIQRKINEKKHTPSVVVLLDDMSIERIYLDTSEDAWVEVEEEDEMESNVDELKSLMEEMRQVEGANYDFRQAVERWITEKGIKGRTKQILLEAVQ